jgi:hypothetical protein
MAEVIFNYRGNEIIIQCQLDEKMEDIINKFLLTVSKNEDNINLFYLYDGSRINNELTFIEQANELDKKGAK